MGGLSELANDLNTTDLVEELFDALGIWDSVEDSFGTFDKSYTSGYEYYMGMHIGVCHGPVDELLEIRLEGRTAWRGTAAPGAVTVSDFGYGFGIPTTQEDAIEHAVPLTIPNVIPINQEYLFGGEKSRGGALGVIDVMPGEDTQGFNPYLAAKCGVRVPAYRGRLTLVFHSGLTSAKNYVYQSFFLGPIGRHIRQSKLSEAPTYHTGFYWGAMQPSVKSISVKLFRSLLGWQGTPVFYPEKATITLSEGVRHNNPVHMLYQCLTNRRWGMRRPYALINDANFRAVADKLYDEGFGLSMLWTGKGRIEAFVAAILRHIDARLYLNPSTGLYELTLVRQPTEEELAAAPLFTVDQMVENGLGKFNRPAWGETINDLTIHYLRPDGERRASTSDQNPANIAIQGAVIPESMEYYGIRDEDLAKRVLARDLRLLSTPMATITELTLSRLPPAGGDGTVPSAFSLHEGALVRLTLPRYNLEDVPFRVGAIQYGSITDTQVTISVVEDVYSMPTTGYIGSVSEPWKDPMRPAENFLAANVRYAPMSYHTVLQMIGAAGATYLNPEYAAFTCMADRPAGMDQLRGMTVLSADTDSMGAAAIIGPMNMLCPTSVLDGDLDLHDGTGALVTSLVIRDINALSLIGVVGSWAFVDDEKILCLSIDTDDESPTYLTMQVERGVLDTIPVAHADGTKMWWFNDVAGSRTVGNTFLKSEAPYLWIAANSATDMTPLSLATPKLHPTLVADWFAPYPPANITFEGTPFRENIGARFEMQVSGRNRLTQSNQFLAWNDTGTEPEAGTTLEVRVYDADTEALLDTVTGIPMLGPEAFYKYDGPTGSSIRIETQTVRGSVKSAQTFSHTAKVCGYGAGYGAFYGGNSKDGVFVSVPGTAYDGSRRFAADKLPAPYPKFGGGRWWELGGADAAAAGLRPPAGLEFVGRVSSLGAVDGTEYHLPVVAGHPSAAGTIPAVWTAPPAHLTTVEALSYAWPTYKPVVNSTYTTGRYGRVYRPSAGVPRGSMTQVVAIPDAAQDFISDSAGKLNLHLWFGTDIDGTVGADVGRVYVEFLDQSQNVLSYTDSGATSLFDSGWLDAETDALFPHNAYQGGRWRPVELTVPANPADTVPHGARYARLTFLFKNVSSANCSSSFNLISARISSQASRTSDALQVATVSDTGFPVNASLQDVAQGWATLTDGTNGWAVSSAGHLQNLALPTVMASAGVSPVCNSLSWSPAFGGSWVVCINSGAYIATIGEVEHPELFDVSATEIYTGATPTGAPISTLADIQWVGQIGANMLALGVSVEDPALAYIYKSTTAVTAPTYAIGKFELVSDILPVEFADIRNWVWFEPESRWYVFGTAGTALTGRLYAWWSTDGLTWTRVQVATTSNTAKIGFPFLRRTGSSTWAIEVLGGASLFKYSGTVWAQTQSTINPLLLGLYATAGAAQWRESDVLQYVSDANAWHSSIMLRTGQYEYSADTDTGNLGQYYSGATLGFDTLEVGQTTAGVTLVSPTDHPYGVKIATCGDQSNLLSDAGYSNNSANSDAIGIYGRNTGKRYFEVMLATAIGSATVTPVVAIGLAVAAGPTELCKAISSAVYTLNGAIYTQGRLNCPGELTLGTLSTSTGFRLIAGNVLGIKVDFAAATIRFFLDGALIGTLSGSTIDTGKQWFPIFSALGFLLTTNLGQKTFTFNPNTGGDTGYVGWI